MNRLALNFLSEYRTSLTNTISLPIELQDNYDIMACLKETEDKFIYLVQSNTDSKQYILKVASPSCKEDLATEFSLLKSIDHPGVPRGIQYVRQDGYSYLVREFFGGWSLGDLVNKKGVLPAEKCLVIAIQLCDILNYLHTQSPPIIHRDIKPENIILTPEGQIKLIDMGISRRYKSREIKDTIFMGTEATAPPEQFGYRQTDRRSDIYSVGVLMFYLLTGSLNIHHLSSHNIPKSVMHMIKKCVTFSPERRYASVRQLRIKLEFLYHSRRVPKPLYGCAGLLVLLAITLSLSSITPDSPSQPQNVIFSSPLIEEAVRIELGKAGSEPLTPDDLKKVSKVLICGSTIYSEWHEHAMYGKDHQMNGVMQEQKGTLTELDDLKWLPNLTELALYNQNIKDLSPLKDLNLTFLGLGGNAIEDLSLLKTLPGLEILNVADNPIEDIEVLKDMTGLKELDISDTGVEDLSPLANLPLEKLSLLDNTIIDYSPLSQMPNLVNLRFRNIPSKGLETVRTLVDLKELTLYNSGIEDLVLFSSLVHLDMLDVYCNEVRSLEGVENLTELHHLGIGKNEISDLTPITKLPKLISIDLNDADIQDYSPLLQIPHLQKVFCDATQASEIEKVRGNAGFDIFILN